MHKMQSGVCTCCEPPHIYTHTHSHLPQASKGDSSDLTAHRGGDCAEEGSHQTRTHQHCHRRGTGRCSIAVGAVG